MKKISCLIIAIFCWFSPFFLTADTPIDKLVIKDEAFCFKIFHREEIAFLKNQIALYPDFPKTGILFEDFFPLLSNAKALQTCIDLFYERYKNKNIDVIVGLESRGFLLGAALAYKLGVGFVPIRKPGKLPGSLFSVNYEKEYGLDTLTISQTAILPNQRVLIIDDLIATGGTAKAAIELVNLAGGIPIEFTSLLEIEELAGREKLGIPSFNLLD
jgi:adenine phosphoribosyltransferase